MTIGDPYVTAPELKTYLGITSALDDTRITNAVNAASRSIEQFCRRQFNTDIATSTRRFRSATTARAIIDDFHTVAGLVVKVGSIGSYTTTLILDTDFFVGPVGDQAEVPGFPFWRLRALSGSPFTCSGLAAEEPNLEVTTDNWGWAAVPDDVTQASQIHAARIYRRKDSTEGVVTGVDAAVPIRVSARTDPDVVALLAPFRKHREGMF